MSLVTLDVDHFKRLNDTYGHPVGDKVLMEVAKTMRANLRAGDLPARVGGEEFMVILPTRPPRMLGSSPSASSARSGDRGPRRPKAR